MKHFIYHWAGDPEGRVNALPKIDWEAVSGIAPRIGSINERKPVLLWVGDAVAHTGFARVTHNVCEYLAKDWSIHVIGLNYLGDPHPYPYPIYPARNGGDIWGLGRFSQMVGIVKPDAVVVLNDPWIIGRFATEINRLGVPMAAYMPVDAKNIPDHDCAKLNSLELAIFYTRFGEAQCRANGYAGKSAVIPHGVDCKTYRPIDRMEARSRLELSRALRPGAYIVGCVNRNQPRKRLDLMIQYFAEWVNQYRLPGNVYLYIHCAQRDAGWNLAQLANYYRVSNRLMLPAEEIVTPSVGLPEHEMPYVYASFDVQASTTMGEGWGLTNAEGAACGVPQIVPQYAALGEWMAEGAYFVPCSSEATHPIVNTIGGVADKRDFVRALDRMYREHDLRSEYGRRALRLVRQPQFEWRNIAKQFNAHLEGMLSDARTRAAKERETGQEDSANDEVQETERIREYAAV